MGKGKIQAEPYDFEFDLDSTALVMIDMQRDFVEPGGFGATLGNDVRPLAGIVPVVRALLEGFRRSRLPVAHTREMARPLTRCGILP